MGLFYSPFDVRERERILNIGEVAIGPTMDVRYVQKESIPVIDPATGEVKHRTIGMSLDGEKRKFPLTPSLIPAWLLKSAWNGLVDLTGSIFGKKPDELENYKIEFIIGFKEPEQVKQEGLPGTTLPISDAPGAGMPGFKDYKSLFGEKLVYVNDDPKKAGSGRDGIYNFSWKGGKVGKYLRNLEDSLYTV